MPLVVPRYTLQDLESFPDDGSRYELDRLVWHPPEVSEPMILSVPELFLP